MSRNVGRLTLAGALIVMGLALVADNLWHLDVAMYIGRLWPVLLILLGLEWIAASRRVFGDEKVKVDPAALVVLGLLAIGMAGWSEARMNMRFPLNRWFEEIPRQVEVRQPAVRVSPVPPILGGTVSEEIETTYETPVAGLQEIDVNDSSAEIKVKSGSALKVTLKAVAYGSTSAEAAELARSLQLRVTPGPITRINTDRLRQVNRFSLSYEIEVPKGVSVRVRSSSGSVTVEEIEGAVDVTASSGGVQVKEVTGNVAVTTSSGAITVEDVGGSVRANANSGSIRIEQVGGAVSAQASSGAIQVETEKVGGPYDLTASSGSIRLSLPEEAGLTVTARASSGTVTGPSWLAIGEGRHSGSGKQGSGEHSVSLRTSSGSIDLKVD